MLLPRLALRGIHANRRLYLPFWIACAFITMVYYIVAAFAYSDDFAANLPNGGNIRLLMGIGCYLLPVVIVPFLVYANSFLLKGRSRELALYAILGLGKRHVALILLIESAIGLAFCLLLGVGAGALFCPLVFDVLLAALGLSVDIVWSFSLAPVLAAGKLLAFCFALLLALNVRRAARTAPAALLREQQQGEKTVRRGSHAFTALAAALCLGGGYALSLQTTLYTFTLHSFMLALLLVICGTYGLFAAGSTLILSRIRKAPRFYTDPACFVIVSGLQHRMRKNAAGLTNICLFGSAALFTLCCSVGVLLGQGDAISQLGRALSEGEIGLNTASVTADQLVMEFTTLAFLGVFFVLVFLACTALVLYYKQLAEGMEDAPRFRILRAVGLSDGDAAHTAARQMRVVFLLPLAASLIHITFAAPILSTLLNILAISSAAVIWGSIALSMLFFCVVYALCYLAARHAYLRTVTQDSRFERA